MKEALLGVADTHIYAKMKLSLAYVSESLDWIDHSIICGFLIPATRYAKQNYA